MNDVPKSTGWLVGLICGSATFMALWFYLYPTMAAICTLAGTLLCLLATTESRPLPPRDIFQAERREP